LPKIKKIRIEIYVVYCNIIDKIYFFKIWRIIWFVFKEKCIILHISAFLGKKSNLIYHKENIKKNFLAIP
jgi:hypothetical protein